ncbi:MAG: acyl-CoA dehydrogenase family protein [Bordetella sp.]|nr:acyl-CoA dehydrogenase family protein [Bordetella sp.]
MKLDLCTAGNELADLHSSVQRVLDQHAAFGLRRQVAASAPGWSPLVWRELVNLGVAGLCAPEDCGGFQRSAADWGDVQRLLGRALSLEPAMATYLCTTALRLQAPAEHRQRLLEPVLQGRSLMAWAHDEPAARHAALWVECAAHQDAQGQWRLSGCKTNVLHGAAAQTFIVSARLAGAPAAADGVALFLLSADGAGVGRDALRLVDDTPAARLTLESAAAQPLAPDAMGLGGAAVLGVRRAGAAAACADMVGAMELAYDLTLEHVRTRRQFGRPLADNQAVRHTVADMVVHLEAATSMAMLAAAAVDDPDRTHPADLSRAKLVVSRSARALTHAAIQLHGGLGMSEEHAVGHCLRRVIVGDQLFGDASAHASALGARLAEEAAHA